MNRITRIKVCVLSVVFTAVLLLAPFSPVHADSFPSAFYVNGNSFYSASQVYVSYMELTEEQKLIAQYLLGMYNLAFLGSRGFAFSSNTYQNTSSFIAKIQAFGNRLFNGAAGIALQSRMDDEFLKYCSAVLLYSSQCNTDFDTWFTNLDDDFTIPVDQGILNSFNLLYNDNSEDYIASYGDIMGEWESGVILGDMTSELGYPWINDSTELSYYNWISQWQYVCFSAIDYDNGPGQCVVGSNTKLPNTLFIKRGSSYSQYRYGYDDNFNLSLIPSGSTYNIATVYHYYSTHKLYLNTSTMSFQSQIFTATANSDLSNFIEYVFNNNAPIRSNNNFINWRLYWGYYPYIEHVILVDTLDTLVNPEEIFVGESWNVFGLTGDMIVPVDTVNLKPKILSTINLPDNTHSVVSIRDIVDIDTVVDDNDSPVNPWQQPVIVQPNDTNPISIDVNFFSGGKIYLEYLWEHTKKVTLFTKDFLDCFEFDAGNGDTYGPKYAVYGVLVLGIAGGLIAKFLL